MFPDTRWQLNLSGCFNAMSQYIVDNRTINVAFVTHVGDIVNTASSTTQWTTPAMNIWTLASQRRRATDLYGVYNDYFGVDASGKPGTAAITARQLQ